MKIGFPSDGLWTLPFAVCSSLLLRCAGLSHEGARYQDNFVVLASRRLHRQSIQFHFMASVPAMSAPPDMDQHMHPVLVSSANDQQAQPTLFAGPPKVFSEYSCWCLGGMSGGKPKTLKICNATKTDDQNDDELQETANFLIHTHAHEATSSARCDCTATLPSI